ncbi:MAG: hypothetical protein RTU30_00730 [Candidatus Thorarchaeota archaeon]
MSEKDEDQDNAHKVVEIMQAISELEEEEKRMLRKLLGMREE